MLERVHEWSGRFLKWLEPRKRVLFSLMRSMLSEVCSLQFLIEFLKVHTIIYHKCSVVSIFQSEAVSLNLIYTLKGVI